MNVLNSIINSIIEISIGCGISVVIVLFLSGFVKKRYHVRWRYFVWLLLAVRMIIPYNVTLPSRPVAVNIPPQAYINTKNAVYTQPVRDTVRTASQVMPQTDSTEKAILNTLSSANEQIPSYPLLFMLWSMGFLCFLIYHGVYTVSYNKYLKRWSTVPDERYSKIFNRLCTEMSERNTSLYLCRELETPVMVGLLCPRIYIPDLDISNEQLELILKHELIHKKRMDLWYKLLILTANAVHWFNPIAYIMRSCSDNDTELICDSCVLDGTSESERTEYANAMLYVMKRSLKRKPSLSTHFLGGGRIMKERFSRLFDTKVKKRGIALFCAVAVISASCACLFGCGGKDDNVQTVKENLFDKRIEYVGDASAVGRARLEIDQIEFANGLVAEGGMELQTTREPYGAVFKYTTVNPNSPIRYKQLEAVAAMYLAMIKNLGSVTLEIKNDNDFAKVTYTPDDIEFYQGIKNISTSEELDELCAKATVYAAEDDSLINSSGNDIDTVIHNALSERMDFERKIRSSWGSEFGSIAHMILRTDEKDDGTVYAYSVISDKEYYFEHINGQRIFTVYSGSGVTPVKITMKKQNGIYTYVDTQYPMDGSMWTKSLEDMDYPKDLLKKITKDSKPYTKYLDDYNNSAAAQYLKELKANGKLKGDIPEVIAHADHTVPDNIDVEASNRLLGMYGEYPYFIGGLERVVNGVRYVYTREYNEKTHVARYVKTEFETGKVIDEAVINTENGELIYLKGTPREDEYSKYHEP